MKFIDLTEKMFGYWKALYYDKNGKWVCLCTACNKTIKSVAATDLKLGRTTHCRCIIKTRPDLDGQIFSDWLAISYDSTDKKRVIQCVKCGEIKKVATYRLLHEPETILCSVCRCYNTRWGGYSTRYSSEYISWSSMNKRCYNIADINYCNYGARGITICDEWKDDFIRFLNDMGQKPTDAHSIDRIDVNGNYCKGNCRWADRKTQSRNRRDNVYETINGITLTRSEWHKAVNASTTSVWRRMNQYGMSFEEALLKNKNTLVMTRVPLPS